MCGRCYIQILDKMHGNGDASTLNRDLGQSKRQGSGSVAGGAGGDGGGGGSGGITVTIWLVSRSRVSDKG